MFPGQTTRLTTRTLASAATIVADKDLLVLTGTTSIDTMTPKSMNQSGQSQICFLLPTGGNVATTTSGNFHAAVTMTDDKLTCWIWVPSLSKWYPHALS
jgi:hypothetical protein